MLRLVYLRGGRLHPDYRSEERRGGEEGRTPGAPYHLKKKKTSGRSSAGKPNGSPRARSRSTASTTICRSTTTRTACTAAPAASARLSGRSVRRTHVTAAA